MKAACGDRAQEGGAAGRFEKGVVAAHLAESIGAELARLAVGATERRRLSLVDAVASRLR